ncbi:uncharacterized protein LOC142587514 isoform X1 [Dermacentor variabilis]|uniref:uncharacterized protein LOC142587514 isoform X1 n=1 Tax=Dermacentor variabilis TaxID=34621 RepID=UPI003F5B1FB5
MLHTCWGLRAAPRRPYCTREANSCSGERLSLFKFADADMNYDDSWQWDIENQDEAAALQCAAPPNAEPAQLVPEPASPLAPAPPAPAPPAAVLPAAVPPVPTAYRERRTNASRSSCPREDAVRSELGARLASITKDAQRKRKEYSLKMKLTCEDHALRMELAREDHKDRL